ncbi:hypothetical protein HPB48_022229 [Haemaphysalis longicornis]|uniref:UEV domain-containing protein n=1 Tax=Haemaphysalis longicornis TaxID=44386 RepID=A0A9J6GZD0_HAELO|nr:hypothetical protein HPB48_022229 [Haemaphysalis longicornis]
MVAHWVINSCHPGAVSVFNDGMKKELFCLDGTIPVNYKGSTYNIPVCIWLLDTHPYNSPMCYVKPTAYMQIKVSRHVDQTGRIFLPYLHDWNPGSSDLLGLIQVMVVVFGETPPVFSKPQDGSPASGYPAARPPAGLCPRTSSCSCSPCLWSVVPLFQDSIAHFHVYMFHVVISAEGGPKVKLSRGLPPVK